jgi:hypothetical protein
VASVTRRRAAPKKNPAARDRGGSITTSASAGVNGRARPGRSRVPTGCATGSFSNPTRDCRAPRASFRSFGTSSESRRIPSRGSALARCSRRMPPFRPASYSATRTATIRRCAGRVRPERANDGRGVASGHSPGPIARSVAALPQSNSDKSQFSPPPPTPSLRNPAHRVGCQGLSLLETRPDSPGVCLTFPPPQ